MPILIAALSLSIGWGVRGNWGHEYGAMIPGALCAIAACLLSGREDWRRRAAYFAFFGALGWSFGGSISYMQVIAYTHSGHWPSQFYGFACLFAVGFLWAAPGGAGTALPATLDRERLTELFVPILAVFIAWSIQDLVYIGMFGIEGGRFEGWLTEDAKQKAEEFIDWYDSDWVAALLAILAVIAASLIRKKFCWGSALIMHLAIGWWFGFLVLTNGLGLRMTPPRGDNWAGMTGLVLGLLVFMFRHGMLQAIFATLVAGFIGGLGFSGVQALKLWGIWATDAYPTNWHSLLEQGYGFVNGLGIAFALGYLSYTSPPVVDEPLVRRWTGPLAVLFTLIAITYLNIRKNVPAVWLSGGVFPEAMHGISTHVWFKAAYVLLALAIVFATLRHYREPLAILPESALGRGQLLYLLFLWWIVLGNASRVFPFDPQRLVTEGVIYVNAVICTLMILTIPKREERVVIRSATDYRPRIAFAFVAGMTLFAVSVYLEFRAARAMFGDEHAPVAGEHYRFGEKATQLQKR